MANLPGVKQFSAIYNEVGNWVTGNNPADQGSTNPTNPGLTQTKQIVNDCYRIVMSKRIWNFLLDIKTLTCATGQTTEYALDDTCDVPFYFRVAAESKRLVMIPYAIWLTKWPAGFTGMGNSSPNYYIPSKTASNGAKQILLFPASDNNTRSVEYGFKKRVLDLSLDTDVMIIPAEWQDVVVNFSKAVAFGKRQDMANEQKYMGLYQQRLGEMMIWDSQYSEWVDSIVDLGASQASSALGNFSQMAWDIGTAGY